MIKSVSIRLALGLVIMGATQLAAQAQGPGNGGPRPDGVTEVPIDGGASLLLAGGVAFGLRRLRRR